MACERSTNFSNDAFKGSNVIDSLSFQVWKWLTNLPKVWERTWSGRTRMTPSLTLHSSMDATSQSTGTKFCSVCVSSMLLPRREGSSVLLDGTFRMSSTSLTWESVCDSCRWKLLNAFNNLNTYHYSADYSMQRCELCSSKSSSLNWLRSFLWTTLEHYTESVGLFLSPIESVC